MMGKAVNPKATTDLVVDTLHGFHGNSLIPIHGCLVSEGGVRSGPCESRKNRAIFETKAPLLR
jgi:hypothetical protein